MFSGYHAGIVQSFTCFTRALHAADHFFAMTQHFTGLGDTLFLIGFWHLCVPKGAELTSFRGDVPFRTLTCRLSSFAMAATV